MTIETSKQIPTIVIGHSSHLALQMAIATQEMPEITGVSQAKPFAEAVQQSIVIDNFKYYDIPVITKTGQESRRARRKAQRKNKKHLSKIQK